MAQLSGLQPPAGLETHAEGSVQSRAAGTEGGAANLVKICLPVCFPMPGLLSGTECWEM